MRIALYWVPASMVNYPSRSILYSCNDHEGSADKGKIIQIWRKKSTSPPVRPTAVHLFEGIFRRLDQAHICIHCKCCSRNWVVIILIYVWSSLLHVHPKNTHYTFSNLYAHIIKIKRLICVPKTLHSVATLWAVDNRICNWIRFSSHSLSLSLSGVSICVFTV